MPQISVIIRSKNEERYIEKVLKSLSKQSFRDFEILLVDDRSTDDTQKIAKKYGCRVVEIREGKFSHPFSCNLGAKNAKGKILVFLNGHSIPCSTTFLEDGLRNFSDPKVAGVYCLPLAHEDGTIVDKILYSPMGYTIGKMRFEAGPSSPGLMGTTNSMFRKSLWDEFHFPQEFNHGWGGEDSEWARHFMARGFIIVQDPKIQVRHSHHLKWKDVFWQLRNWGKMGKNNPENPPERQRKYF